LRSLSLLAASLAAAALLAGCGGGSSTTTAPTSTFDEASNSAYERSYSDCGSVKLVDLAHRYKVKQNKDAVATAVGKYWADRAGGGAAAADAGKQGCEDGFAIAGG
jgi:hypothetical protein